MLIDTHCHIHDPDYPYNGDEVINRAHEAGVMQIICIGTNEKNSSQAIEFASKYDGVFASIGVHPHYATDGIGSLASLVGLLYSRKHLQPEFDKASGPLSDPARSRFLNKRSRQGGLSLNRKLVAIGEIGLDYYYTNSPRDDQIRVLKLQIELALKYDLPIIFHVREAYDDFWSVLDSFQPDLAENGKFAGQQIRGVLHCFTDTLKNAKQGLKRGLFIGINGISTFTKDELQKEMFAAIPLDRILFETDAPYLTPAPLRGKIKVNTFTKDELQKEMFAAIPLDRILFETDAPYLTPAPLRGKIKVNEPAFIKNIAEYSSQIYDVSINEIADITTANARTLFNL